MNNNQTIRLSVIIIVFCALVPFGYWLINRSWNSSTPEEQMYSEMATIMEMELNTKPLMTAGENETNLINKCINKWEQYKPSINRTQVIQYIIRNTVSHNLSDRQVFALLNIIAAERMGRSNVLYWIEAINEKLGLIGSIRPEVFKLSPNDGPLILALRKYRSSIILTDEKYIKICKTGQQVDSAEASTIAVPPSMPSGSPR